MQNLYINLERSRVRICIPKERGFPNADEFLIELKAMLHPTLDSTRINKHL